ncbi:MAG: hypothetical protein CMA35_02735 [Euryarchaeota archaeon]|nr:hypothetical protein [Euryarchaeota archaeon]|tara:strand:- start:4386 stop:5273 length:888 start_codon:yes stop_codon:yes gene_type:complete
MMSILSFGRVQVFLNQARLEGLMKKALAQNPNLLRTLIGLSLTLIFMLSYAVYGATVSPSYYIYETEATNTEFNEIELDKQVIDNETYWTTVLDVDAQNLTWVNMSIDDLASGAIIKLSNTAKLYSHQFLGVEDAKVTVNGDKVDFRCSEHCQHSDTIEVESEDSSIELRSLTSTNPARRSNGTVYADNIEEAEQEARKEIDHLHGSPQLIIEIKEPGDKSVQPVIVIHTVNEEFSSIEVYSIDAATEFLWALAAVVGCFSMVLIPSFTVYFAARAKDKKREEKLKLVESETVDE